MSVAIDTAGTEVSGSGVTTLDLTGMVVGSGSNRALKVSLAKSAQAASTSVKWDPAGANQSLTSIGGANGTGTVARSEEWGLVNPTTGSSKIVRWAGAASDVALVATSWTGVNQTGGATSFPNFNSATGTQGTSTTQNNGVTITSATGNATTAAHCTDQGTMNSTNQTQLFVDNTPATISTAGNRAAGAATVSMTSNLTTGGAAAHWVAAGSDIAASSSSNDWSSTGTGTATFIAQAMDTTVWNASGVAVASFNGKALDSANWIVSGVTVASFNGQALDTADWSAIGASTVAWVGEALQIGTADWQASGASIASWVPSSLAEGAFASAGASTVRFAGGGAAVSGVTRDGWRVQARQAELRRRKDEKELMAIAAAVLPYLQRGHRGSVRITL